MLDLSGARNEAFVALVKSWLNRRAIKVDTSAIEVLEVERLLSGRPGLLDVVARVGTQTAHLVLGLHSEHGEITTLGALDEGILGELEDERGRARVVDALMDADLAPLLMIAIVGEEPGAVALVRDELDMVILDIEDRCRFTVFSWLNEWPNPAVEMLVNLDEVGFNHLAAPIALWRRRGRDLGVVTEQLTERTDGWALALSSLRDLLGSALSPEEAGGDFALEASALGTMTARMHLASQKAFGRGEGAVAQWAAEMAASFDERGCEVTPAAVRVVDLARCDRARYATVRTHGDLDLSRTARTNHGWVIADWRPGGVDSTGRPVFFSPASDVATMMWSLHRVATAALEERDPALRSALESAASAWEARNRGAYLSGYLDTPGIAGLVGSARPECEALVALFELGYSVIDQRAEAPRSMG